MLIKHSEKLTKIFKIFQSLSLYENKKNYKNKIITVFYKHLLKHKNRIEK